MIIRQYRPQDEQAVLAVINRAAIHDHTNQVTLEGFRSVWQNTPGAPEDAYEQTALAITKNGQILGFAWWEVQSQLHLNFEGWVDPDWRRKGLGTALLTAIDVYIRRYGSSEVSITARGYQDILGVPELFRLKGYNIAREFYTMAVNLKGRTFEVPIPPGITLRSFEGNDLDSLVETDNEIFADHWGSQPREVSVWRNRMMVSRPHDPKLWTLACAEDRIVGECLTHASIAGGPNDAHVSTVGVQRQWRGLGLGRALLAQGLRKLQEVGFETARLNVDSENTSAVNLYRSLGMDVVRTRLHFQKMLRI